MTRQASKDEIPLVSRNQREAIKNQKASIIWLTGLPSAGKSTLAKELDRQLNLLNYHTAILDGDNLRQGLNRDLGFTESERSENIRRAGEVAKLFVEAGIIVIAAFITPFNQDQKLLRKICGHDFIEVFCDCPLNICQQRDVKGLYKRALSGELKQFTGVSSPYQHPKNPTLTINTNQLNIQESVELIINYLKKSQIIR